jgi:hypothetical protein
MSAYARPKTLVPWVCVVRHGIHILDLLPTQLAPADVGEAADDGTKRDCTATMVIGGPARPSPPARPS